MKETMKDYLANQQVEEVVYIDEITLSDGSIQKINTDLTFGAIKRAQAAGELSPDFHTRLLNALSSDNEADLINMDTIS